MSEPVLLIVGASVRAAASSASKDGFAVFAVDLFADRDLQSIAAECHQISQYPDDIVTICNSIYERFPDARCMYTGAIENHLMTLQAMENEALVGNDSAIVRRVRDPFVLRTVFKQSGIPFPTTARVLSTRRTGKWLRKAFRSAGGQHVAYADSSANIESDSYYFQEFIDGEVCSAVFVSNRNECTLLGVSDMLVGEPWLGCEGFAYCGSIVRTAEAAERSQWEHIGNVLRSEFGLVGVFGVDGVLKDGRVHPIEVNPRYTASMELFEQDDQPSIVRQHINACDGAAFLTASQPTSLKGKAILFAKENCQFPQNVDGIKNTLATVDLNVQLADIPTPGNIERGHPILTILTAAKSRSELNARLIEASNAIYTFLAK